MDRHEIKAGLKALAERGETLADVWLLALMRSPASWVIMAAWTGGWFLFGVWVSR